MTIAPSPLSPWTFARAALAFGLLVPGCTTGVTEANGLTFGSGPPATAGASSTAADDDGADTERDASTGEGEAESSSSTGGADASFTGGTDPSGDAESDTEDSDTTSGPTGCGVGESRACYTGPDNTENQGECASGTETCDASGAWGGCMGELLPGAETCNALDDDCNGIADDGDPGGGGACSSGLQGPCQPGTLTCAATGVLDCEPDVQPAASETCGNAVDDDCNGTTDDGCICDPLNPAAICGAGNHCVPAADGVPLCIGPTGTGVQYTTCLSSTECAAQYECITTGIGPNYCMQWCTSDLDCPIPSDSCIGLTPPVGVGPTQWGVCYDGLP